MRLTLITEHYPPSPGGVATSSKRLAEALTVEGHSIQVLTFDNSRPLVSADYALRSFDSGVEIIRSGPFFLRHPELATTSLSEKLRAVFRRRAYGQMAREARAFAPDAVIGFYLLNAGFISRLLAAELGVPAVVGVRGNDVGLNIFHVERFGVVLWTVQGADAIVCVNQHLKRRLLTIAPDLERKTSVIPNGVAWADSVAHRASARARVSAETGWNAGNFVLVFIGTLREKKGIAHLLSAIEELGVHSSIRLLVVGPDIGVVERRICGEQWARLRENKIVYCTGQVARETVQLWASAGDALIMPSLDDGLANGLLEGMALGLCPVASEVFSDVIRDEETGILFSTAYQGDLASKLQALASDSSRANRIGLAARDYVRQEHEPRREALQYVEVVAPLVARSRGPR